MDNPVESPDFKKIQGLLYKRDDIPEEPQISSRIIFQLKLWDIEPVQSYEMLRFVRYMESRGSMPKFRGVPNFIAAYHMVDVEMVISQMTRLEALVFMYTAQAVLGRAKYVEQDPGGRERLLLKQRFWPMLKSGNHEENRSFITYFTHLAYLHLYNKQDTVRPMMRTQLNKEVNDFCASIFPSYNLFDQEHIRRNSFDVEINESFDHE